MQLGITAATWIEALERVIDDQDALMSALEIDASALSRIRSGKIIKIDATKILKACNKLHITELTLQSNSVTYYITIRSTGLKPNIN
jgi:transcriptional regulator with XRE-family HTH domain